MKSRKTLMVTATLALLSIVACSSRKGSRELFVDKSPKPVVRPAAMVTVEPIVAPAVEPEKAVVRPPMSKLVTFRSRDYGVSFTYPWQYAFRSARAIATSDGSLRPQSDGHDGQVTLARVDVPKGFYAGSDFESGYFTLSLNPNLEEEKQCGVPQESGVGKSQTTVINSVTFRWMESDSGGHGSAERRRNYAAFSNGVCYQIEMAVRTANPDGTARELDPEQVMRRLEGILQTVTIAPATKDVAASPVAQQ